VDVTSYSHRRYDKDAKESYQAESSKFGSPNPDGSGQIDLARRISARLDLEPAHGGKVEVLATNIDVFELNYLDPTTGLWTDKWDSTQALGQHNQLPLQMKILLVLRDGIRDSIDRSRQPLRFITKVSLALRDPLTFGVE
jgi:general secretion pathway protein J